MHNPDLSELSRFFLVGCCSAIAHFGVLIILVQWFLVGPILASIAGALLGAVVNYCLNRHFTFNSKVKHAVGVPRFTLIAVTSLALNTGFMWVGTELLRLHYLIAQSLATALVFLWSYFSNKVWTFGDRFQHESSSGTKQ
jgi:putative flippase GtrA